ncbi:MULTISPECIES: sugar phosphate isomerase/epimerase family protein [Arthrobacter]|uniref:Sugar phosphate isomerase/epimerase family protein n=2 Tax=Arthrobacter TaxID=1663 RepID=A0ABU9KLE3_9MICC|nr:sugar phosphate isomerase/epimerase family protein [Arthrobacter sp. YJM1]MDP5227622.1 sugar phosphate isomerase/epimerase family protein [Arthrobacter sp. YJM1]
MTAIATGPAGTASTHRIRVGVDGKKIPEAAKRGALATIDHAHELGMDGLFFRTILDMSPTLDAGELKELRQRADDLDLYLETGLGKVNPFANPEAPELRSIGDGDIVLGFRRMMEAAAAIGCRELWVATANFKGSYFGRFAYDRFRTDVDWSDQLAATEKFLHRLAPIARDLGIHMNLETHEEITSFELVRLVEAVGPDVTGIVYDTANVLQRMEHPVYAARRVALYVRQTHLKDAYVAHDDGGLVHQLRPYGEGVVDFAGVLPIIVAANPTMNVTIENPQSYLDKTPAQRPRVIEAFNPEFLVGHPDLSVEELAAYLDMVHHYEQRVTSGEVADWRNYLTQPYEYAEAVECIKTGARMARQIIGDAGYPLHTPLVQHAAAGH